MSFLHPFILYGLPAAVAVPVLVHLLNRRRHDRVAWAAMRFLRVAEQRNRRRLRVEDLLLLAMRIALLALLSVALARPTAKGFAAALPGRRSVAAAIVLDQSYSMAATDGVAARLDRGKQAAAAVIDALPPGSSAAVLLASDVVVPVIPLPTRDLPLARELLGGATAVDRPTDLLPAVRSAEELLRPIAGAKVVYVVTDGQRSGWSRLDDVATVLHQPDAAPCHVLLVGPPVRRNAAVTDVRRGGDLSATNRPSSFQVTVANRGTVELTDVPVRLRLDADPAVVAAATVDRLAPGESRAVSLYATPTAVGSHTATAFVPPDDLPADDARTVAFRAVDRVDVLVVSGEVNRRDRPPATAFLRGALLPVPPAKRPTYVVRVTTIPAADLPATALDRYAAVFTAGVAAFPPATLDALAAYVRTGGGLVVFPGEAATDAEAVARLHLLPATLGDARGDAAKQDAFTTFAADAYGHPIVAPWADPANGSMASAHFFRTFDLTPDPATTADAGPARVVVPFADGRPAAVERAYGRGRTILFAFPAGSDWSDLPDHGGLFVPLVNRCLAAVVNRADEPLNVAVGQPIAATVPIETVGRTATVTPPVGEPSSVVVALDGSAGVVRYEATDHAGPYTVAVGDTTVRLAAAADAAESIVDPLTAADRAALSAVATVTDWTPGSPAVGVATAGLGGDDLWLLIAVAALAVGVAEPLLANRWSRSR